MLAVLHPQNSVQATALREKFNREMERYAHDEAQVDAKEQRIEIERQLTRRKANRFDGGELLCEMALVLCSITLLTRQRRFWFAGIIAGSLGFVISVSAFLVK